MRKHVLLLLFSLIPLGIYSQQFVVTGLIKDAATGEELMGVSIQEKGTTNGVISELDGTYSITTRTSKPTLVYTYVGYKTKEVAITKSGAININLESDAFMMDEVVAIGYGSMKKSDITGAIGSVSSEKLRAAPVAKLDQALQGRMAGVTVNSNSGQPGAAAEIRIRGVGTVGNASPIYVVDGVITDNIDYLATSDIASLEVLKDASSAAIYGSRGANGVILVTTKKGNNTGKTNLTFETYVGFQNKWKKMDVMGRDEFVNTRAIFSNTKDELDEVGLNDWIRSNYTPNNDVRYPRVISDSDPNGIDYTKIDTDWQDAVFEKNAIVQNYYFSADGGTDKANYMFSVNYFDQDGILIGSNYNRLSVRANTSFKVRDWLRIGENLSYSNSHSRNVQGNSNTALIASALSMAPWDPVKYPEGTYSNTNRANPVAKDLSGQYAIPSLFRNVTHPYNQVYHSKPNNSNDDWVGNVFAEITPIKGLTLRGDVSMKLWYGTNRTFTDVLDVGYNPVTENSVSSDMTRTQNMKYEGTATYNTNFNNSHDLSILLGVTTEESNTYGLSASGIMLSNTDEKNWYISTAPNTIIYNDDGTPRSTRSGGDNVSRKRMASYFGRVHYSFKDKYILTTNLRIDGSSWLTEGHYWKVFPSVAGAWKISEEEFFEPLLGDVEFLKLRAGWGRMGNERSVAMNTANYSVSTGTSWMVGYPFGNPNTLQSGMSILNVPMNLEWETTEQTNIGIDFTVLKGLLNGSLDLFQRNTYDMIMSIKAPGHVGFRYTATGNAATVRNRGVELMLEHKNKIQDFTYSIGGNFSFIDNELTKLNGGETIWDGIIMSTEAYALRSIYVRKYDGVFQTQEEIDNHVTIVDGVAKVIQPNAKPGDARYLDLNGDGEITDEDRTVCGNPFPKLTYGFNASLEYKGFDLQLFFQGVAKVSVYNYLRQNKLEYDGSESVLGTDMRNAFIPGADPDDPTRIINILPGSNGSIPNPTSSGSTENKANSSRFVEDASYLRLKNIQLGYTIPRMVTTKIGIDRLRLYVAAQNLLTFTKYKGFDPEVSNSGRDYGNYPQARTIMFGLNMNF